MNTSLDGTGEALGARKSDGEAASDGKQPSGANGGGGGESGGGGGRGGLGAAGKGEDGATDSEVTPHVSDFTYGYSGDDREPGVQTEMEVEKSGGTGLPEKEASVAAAAREEGVVAATIPSPDDLVNFMLGHSSMKSDNDEHEGTHGEGAGAGGESSTDEGGGGGGGDGGDLESGGGVEEEPFEEGRSAASSALGMTASAEDVDCELEVVRETPCEAGAECPPHSSLPVTVEGIQVSLTTVDVMYCTYISRHCFLVFQKYI